MNSKKNDQHVSQNQLSTPDISNESNESHSTGQQYATDDIDSSLTTVRENIAYTVYTENELYENVGSASSITSTFVESSFESNESSAINATSQSIQKIELAINKSYSSHKGCVICKENSNVKLTTVPSKAIQHVFLRKCVIIPKGSRCCHNHLNEYGLIDDDSLDKLTVISDRIILSASSITEIIMNLRDVAINNNTVFAQFKDISTIESKKCYDLTGFTKEEFVFIFDNLKNMRSSDTR